MKLKRLREDFVVDEISDFRIDGGPFAVYRLEKSGIGTPEAISEILKVWNIPRRAVGYGGLKDRHAVTSQHISLFRGPQRNMEQRGFRLTFLGQAKREFHAKDILANRFRITLRSLTDAQSQQMLAMLSTLRQGVPNYFDDQRFGSLGESGQFVAEPWCRTDYERALFLAMAEPNPHDRPREREQKDILRRFWGDWNKCKDLLDRSHRRSIVTYLVDHPTDFKRAVALIRIDLRSLYVAAFQSHLWNELACKWWRKFLPPEHLEAVQGRAGELLFFRNLPEGALTSWQDAELPLPSARQHTWPDGALELLNESLSKFEMDYKQIRLKYPRDTFFSKGSRSLLVRPEDLQGNVAADELSPGGLKKLELSFSLARGSYATMVVKVLSHSLDREWEDEDEQPPISDEGMQEDDAGDETEETEGSMNRGDGNPA
ncbi:MAG: tRNA pseudouridine(13) synthase TruD [Pirellulales bacterium]